MSTERPDTSLEALLEFVRDTRGFDFTGYKRTTIQRRVVKRMTAVGAERYDDYVDYLELHGEEFAELFNALLINTTTFFRDPQTWEHVATDVAPQLLAARQDDSPIRGVVCRVRVRRGALHDRNGAGAGDGRQRLS